MLNRRQQRERRASNPLASFVSFRANISAILGVLLLVAPALVASVPPPATPKRGGTLRVAWRTDPQWLDPALVSDYFNMPLTRLCYQGLLDYDEGDNLVPWLAEAMPTLSPDHRTYTFRLRKAVRFSNGRELVAEDFVYTLERSLNPQTGSPYQSFLLNIAGAREFQEARSNEVASAGVGGQSVSRRWIEPVHVAGLRASDRYTLAIRLVEPEPPFLLYLTMPLCFVVPREEVEKPDTTFASHPVGVGPFLLKEWRRGARLRFERNPQYYLPGQPWLDAVEVMIGPDEATAQMMFERGELGLVLEINPGDFVRLTRDPKWRGHLRSRLMDATKFMTLNCELPPFTDVRVRQAMNFAVDKDRILKLVNGRGQVARGVLSPGTLGDPRRLADYSFNQAKAKQLLAEAGYTNGFPLTIWVALDYPDHRKIAQAVKHDLEQVGASVEVKEVTTAAFTDQIMRRKTVQAAVVFFVWDYPDPSEFLDKFLGGDSLADTGGLNWAFYSTPEYDGLLRKAAREIDRPQRLRLYEQAEKIAVADAPWLFLYHPMDYRLVQPWVKGYQMHCVWQVRYEKLWIDK